MPTLHWFKVYRFLSSLPVTIVLLQVLTQHYAKQFTKVNNWNNWCNAAIHTRHRSSHDKLVTDNLVTTTIQLFWSASYDYHRLPSGYDDPVTSFLAMTTTLLKIEHNKLVKWR